MKFNKLIIIMLLLVSSLGFSSFDAFDYDKAWKEVATALEKGLPKTALSKINEIYNYAVNESNTEQLIKSTMSGAKLTLDTEELGLEEVVSTLEKRISEAKSPSKQLLHSLTADLFKSYYNNQYYSISQRTNLASFDTGDIRTWAPNNYRDFIADEYLKSIDDDIKGYKTSDYKALLSNEKAELELRPTLYDLLVDRALNYFSTKDYNVITSSFDFELDDKKYFSPLESFINLDIPNQNTSKLNQAVGLFQDQLKRQLAEKNDKVLASYDLKRIDFVMSVGTMKDKQSCYEESLQQAISYHEGRNSHPFVIRLAQTYVNSQRYDEGLELLNQLNNSEKYITAQKQNLLNSINQKHLDIVSEKVVPSNINFLVNVTSRNLDKIYFRLMEASEEEFSSIFSNDRKKQHKKINGLKIVKSWESSGLKKGYNQSTYEEIIDGLDYGRYIIASSNEEGFDVGSSAYQYTAFFVSDIAYSTYSQLDGKKMLVRHRKTGKPLSGVKIEVMSREYNDKTRTRELVTKQNTTSLDDGWAEINGSRNNSYSYKLKKGDDRLNLETYDYFYRMNKSDYSRISTEVFTDRAIYRPGQTVHFKTISLEINKDGVPSVKNNHKVDVVLNDANGQEVSRLKLKSNEFGSASGNFVLPVGRLTGDFSLNANGTYHSFKVEEYKRPKFEVEIDPLDVEVSLGDSVTISGIAKALSGSPTSNAKVKYKIMRQTYYGWWSWYRRVPSSSEVIQKGELSSDTSGKYELEFLAEADADMILKDNPTYSYEVSIDVTDLSGETRSAQKVISVSALPYSYTMNLPEVSDITELDKVNVKAVTANGVNLSSTATLKITELEQPTEWKKPRSWGNPSHFIYDKNGFEERIDRIGYNTKSELSTYPEKRVVHESKINIPKEGFDMDLSKYVEGGSAYKIELISEVEYQGVNINQTQYLATTDFKKNKYPVVDLLYVKPNSPIAEVGEKYEIQLGTSDKELTVYYYIVRDETIVHKGMADVNNEYTICYKPKEKDRGGISLIMDYVKHNYHKQVRRNIEMPWTHKKLDVQLITKRDKVLPGSKEEWMLKISGTQKDKAIAEVLATMYDASLDQFIAHQYMFDPYISHYGNINSQFFGFENAVSGSLNYRWNRSKNDRVNPPIIPMLKGMDYGFGYSRVMLSGRAAGVSTMKRSMPASTDGVMMESEEFVGVKVGDVANTTYDPEDSVDLEEGDDTNTGPNKNIKEISIRKNLDESVFFYPHLNTDEEGNLLISFTMNEALTTWKLLTLAHDKDLRYGLTSHEVKTQKDVMILPNAPRFLREGDRIVIPATVSNLTNRDISVSAQLELVDPETDQVINSLFGIVNSEKDVSVAKGISSKVDWEIQVPENYKKLVKYRVTAKSGSHSDGEENILPVVTNQKLLTETKVISVKGNESKSFTFGALANASNTAVPHRYTFEYTSNPIWYAVQALPYLMEYPHQCTEQIFNRMYANTLANHIANENQRIKAVFDQWKALDSDALLSNLEKNSELKSAILEETPWVRAAKSETEQKKRIALLFDLNKMSAETNSILDELSQRQMSSGAFPWFAGGRENVYITQNIVEGIAHLQHLGVLSNDDQRITQILDQALVFLDEETAKRYRKLKDRIAKYGGDIDKDHLDRLSIHYLYIRSFFKNREVLASANEAYNYYLGQSKKYWLGNGLYLESMIGLTLLREGAIEYKDVEKSLTERSFYSEELGRYWNIGNGFNWHELPIESHAMLIEFFSANKANEDFVEDMKIWLLKNKQTNHWKTTKATSAAIYALLIQGEKSGMIEWIEETTTNEIKIGNKLVDQSSAEAGTGYFKKSWNSSEITVDLGKVEIDNKNESISWGAAYYQYFEDLDKVDNFDDTPLKITRNLFKEEMTNNGPQLLSIENEPIKPGDRIIIRIEIKVDRNMSYVHLKDMRGSGFEPENVLSGYKWKGGIGYYESTRDLASHFFISQLNKGTYVFEYPMRAVHKGEFSSGMASIQCMYAPEFTSHSEGSRVVVD